MNFIYKHPKLYDLYIQKIIYAIELQMRTNISNILDKCENKDTILDIACGTGLNCFYFGKKYPKSQMIGLDLSEKFLRYTKMKNKKLGLDNIVFIKQDITKCSKQEISKKNIDVIICTLGFSAISNWEKAIEQSVSILKPGGHLVVSDLYTDGTRGIGKLNNIISKFFFNAYNDRKILDKLKSSLKEINTIEINIKPKYKTNLFIFHGIKRNSEKNFVSFIG